MARAHALSGHPQLQNIASSSLCLCQCLGQTDISWWRHQMKTFSVLPAFCEGNPPVTAPSWFAMSWLQLIMPTVASSMSFGFPGYRHQYIITGIAYIYVYMWLCHLYFVSLECSLPENKHQCKECWNNRNGKYSAPPPPPIMILCAVDIVVQMVALSFDAYMHHGQTEINLKKDIIYHLQLICSPNDTQFTKRMRFLLFLICAQGCFDKNNQVSIIIVSHQAQWQIATHSLDCDHLTTWEWLGG